MWGGQRGDWILGSRLKGGERDPKKEKRENAISIFRMEKGN